MNSRQRVGSTRRGGGIGVLACVGLLILAIFHVGCGGRDRGAGPTPPSSAALVAEGWARFEDGDLAAAESAFTEAETLDPSHAPAPHGLGWTYLRLGRLDAAHAALERATDAGFAAPDLDAAQALVLRDLAPVDWNAARTAADRLLGTVPLYVFVHDPDLDWRDLRLLAAQASFFLGDYARVRAEIIALGAVPPSPDGEDYVAELLRVLDTLGG